MRGPYGRSIWGKYCACDPVYCRLPVAVIKTGGRVFPNTDRPRLLFIFFLYHITLKVTFVLNYNKSCLVKIWHTKKCNLKNIILLFTLWHSIPYPASALFFIFNEMSSSRDSSAGCNMNKISYKVSNSLNIHVTLSNV